tara:strand:- start:5832 stop:6536 length:705 start_codon:yes stop_codon:yes gene_type:complete
MSNDEDDDYIMSGGADNSSSPVSTSNHISFVEYITSFTSKEKSQLLNLIQYGGLSVLPLLIILKLMKIYIPDDDPFKPTTEILFEIVIQIITIIVALFITHKIILYFPTYSNLDYDNFSLLSTLLPLFFLMFTLDTKFSNKLNTLFDRLLVALGISKDNTIDIEEKTQQSSMVSNGMVSSLNVPTTTNNPSVSDGLERLSQGTTSTRDEQVMSGPVASNSSMMNDAGGYEGYQF